jgi:hypothetical protein
MAAKLKPKLVPEREAALHRDGWDHAKLAVDSAKTLEN